MRTATISTQRLIFVEAYSHSSEISKKLDGELAVSAVIHLWK